MKQLRVYTLKDKESADKYFRSCWPKHMVSLPRFGIYVNDVFLGGAGQENQIIAVVTMPDGCDVKELNEKYMKSADFREDMADFHMSDIIKVDEIIINESLF